MALSAQDLIKKVKSATLDRTQLDERLTQGLRRLPQQVPSMLAPTAIRSAVQLANMPRPDVTRFTPQYNQARNFINNPPPQVANWAATTAPRMEQFTRKLVNLPVIGTPAQVAFNPRSPVQRFGRGIAESLAGSVKSAGTAFDKNFNMIAQGKPLQQRLPTVGVGAWNTAKAISQVTPQFKAASLIPAAIGAGIAKVQGQDVFKGAGKGFSEYQGWRPLLGVTNPAISGISNKLAAGNSFAVSQGVQRGVHAVGNVIEDEVLARLNQMPVSNRDRVFSLAMGAGMAGNSDALKALSQNDSVIAIAKALKRTPQEVAKTVVDANNSTRSHTLSWLENGQQKVLRGLSKADASDWTKHLQDRGLKWDLQLEAGSPGKIGASPKPPTDPLSSLKQEDLMLPSLNHDIAEPGKTLSQLKFEGKNVYKPSPAIPLKKSIEEATNLSNRGGDGTVGQYPLSMVKPKNGRLTVYYGTRASSADRLDSNAWRQLRDGSYLSLTKGAERESLGNYGAGFYAKQHPDGRVVKLEIPIENLAVDKITGELRYVDDTVNRSQLTQSTTPKVDRTQLTGKALSTPNEVLAKTPDQTGKPVETQSPLQSPSQSINPQGTGIPSLEKTSNTSIPSYKTRGFVSSVQAAENVTDPTKSFVKGQYTPKPNTKLMGEAQALLQENASIDFKNTKDLDKKVAATIQEAINQQKSGNYEAAANLFNNLSEQSTELGRGVQALSLLKKMTPEAIALSVAGKIKKYNLTAKKPIPELNAEQTKLISDKVKAADLLSGREKQIALFELKNILDNFIPSTKGEKLITVWKAGLLTSLRTHERNLIGNTIHQVAEIGKDFIAMPVDKLLSMKTGQRTLTATTKGMRSGINKQTRQQVKDLIRLGFDPSEQINKWDIKRITWGNSKLEKFLKIYTDAVFRTLGAEDKPFYNAAYARSLYDQAGAAAINAGKRGDKTFIQGLVEKPTEQMLKNAISEANIATFKNQTTASNVANAIKRSVSGNEYAKFAGEFIMPFTGVPSSIFTQLKNYSPIGLTQGMMKAGKVMAGRVPELQRQAAQEIGRGVVGTGLFGLGAYLMSRGLVTGQPKDQEEARQWELENKPRNSIYIGGKWRSLNSIGPEAFIFLSGAKLQEELADPDGSLGSYVAGLGKDFLDQSFVTGVQQPVNAITDPARYGKSYVGNSISSFIPNIVKDTSKAFDSTAREANSIVDYAKNSVPLLRNTMVEKRDALGNVVRQEPTGISAFIDLFNSKTPNGGALVEELSRLYNEGYGATPSKLKKEQTINGQKYVLTPEQLNAYEAGTSVPLQKSLEKFVKSDKYQRMTDEQRQKQIDTITQDVRAAYKKTNADVILSGATPVSKVSFQKKSEDPQNVMEKIALAAQGMTKDPATTIKAIFTQEELRKIEGNAVILKRQEFLNKANDPTMQRDHIIPLGLGGDNSENNLMYVPKDWHEKKTKNDVRLISELQSGKITRQEAQKQVKEWVEANPHTTYIMEDQPQSTEGSIINREFEVDYEDEYGTTKTKTIKIEVPDYPTLTGQTEVDKKLKSGYYSKLTTAKNNTIKLYEAGKITAEQAEEVLLSLDAKQKKAGGKKGKKVTLGKAQQIKKVSFTPTRSRVAQAKVTTPKIKLASIKQPRSSKPKINLMKASDTLTGRKSSSRLQSVGI